MPATESASAPESLVLCCYGVQLRVLDAAGLWLCDRLRRTLPPEFVPVTASSDVAIDYVVTAVVAAGETGHTEYLVTCDAAAVFATAVPDDVCVWLRRDIDRAVAQRCHQMLFVHAGVVAWRGVAIVIPGRDPVGKSTVVDALVSRGADYYSDTYAVLDDDGRVHPYRNLIDDNRARPTNLRLMRAGRAPEPVAVGLIVTGSFNAWHSWRPTVVRGPLVALPLVDSTVRRRDGSDRVQQIAARVATGAVGLRGPRPEAQDVAAHVLDVVDDALVSLPIYGTRRSVAAMGAALAQVAHSRFRTPAGRPVSPWRQLIAARYVQQLDLLTPAEHQRLLEYVRDDERDGWHVRTCRPHGPDSWLDTSDRPRTLPDARRDDVWDMFERRLRALLPWVRQQLDVRHFALGRIEWRATRSDRHGTFVPRMTAGEKEPAPGPRIFGVYFLRAGASPHGGELRLYDTWQTESSRVDAASYTSLRPIDNSIVFWLRGESHEFFPEPTHQADANIAITFTFWEDTATDRVDDSQVCASADVETPLGRGANVPVAPSFMESARSPAPAPARRSNGRRPGRQLVAVVVPAHRALSQDDRIALRHLRTHLGEFDRYVVGATVPAGEFSDFLRPSAPACAFADRMSYNRMLVSESFYRVFARYEYILIYQLDSLVFSNQLEDWCRKDYDYVGAPWFERWHRARSARNESIDDVIDGFGTVGNGGFSLRKVDAALAVLTAAHHPLYDRHVQNVLAGNLHEDIFWSFLAPQLLDRFRIPSPREALLFAFETEPRYCYRENHQRLPFGCHGWPSYEREFWERFLMK